MGREAATYVYVLGYIVSFLFGAKNSRSPAIPCRPSYRCELWQLLSKTRCTTLRASLLFTGFFCAHGFCVRRFSVLDQEYLRSLFSDGNRSTSQLASLHLILMLTVSTILPSAAPEPAIIGVSVPSIIWRPPLHNYSLYGHPFCQHMALCETRGHLIYVVNTSPRSR